MSDTRLHERPAPIQPRFELEDAPADRLVAEALPLAIPPRAGIGTVSLTLAGVVVLVMGLAVLQVANFVVDQFARGPALGWLTLGVALAGFGLLGTAIWRELRGLFALRSVDRLRAELANPTRARRAARIWVASLPDAVALLPALDATDDPAAILALLRAGPVATLRAQAEALGRRAAMQIFAATAAVPSPALDGLLVGWRGLRLVREVAALHGQRPGLLATLALLRRTALSAAGVMATDLATDTLARAALSHPLLAHVAGDVAGAGVAARRMVVLARAASAACEPCTWT